jgi:hypothetical protein
MSRPNSALARSAQNTHHRNHSLGWATITHPFHPRFGEKFTILKSKRWDDYVILSLKDQSGNLISVPLGWTDRDNPVSFPSYLKIERLIDLCKISEILKKGADK